jgi:hypothetical protein
MISPLAPAVYAASCSCGLTIARDIPSTWPQGRLPGDSIGTTLGLTGLETFAIDGIASGLSPKKKVNVTAVGEGGKETKFTATVRIDTPNEVDYFVHGGILLYMLRQLAKPS